MGLLEGKKILVTGVLTESSIAFHVARLAQEEGAEVVLTGFGRAIKITSAIAKRLPAEPPVLELGARVHEHQPTQEGDFRVYLDPAGHPFCLVQG